MGKGKAERSTFEGLEQDRIPTCLFLCYMVLEGQAGEINGGKDKE